MHPGTDLLASVSSARRSVTLVAPFMTVNATRRVIEAISVEVVDLTLVTRWRPEEVVAGVSDLAVFDLVESRTGTRLLLHPRLHAKLYQSDEHCLVGSANLTEKALGWTDVPNVELLVSWNDVKAVDEFLVALLGESYLATAEIRDLIASQTEAASKAQSIPPPWLPRCASPGELWKVYAGTDLTTVLDGALQAGKRDLKDLEMPAGISREAFADAVSDKFLSMPLVSRILSRMGQGVSSEAGAELLRTGVPHEHLPYGNAETAWQIFERWLLAFGGGEFRSKSVGQVLWRGRHQ